MNETGKLAEALAKAQSAFPEIKKNKTVKVRMKQEKGGGEYSYKYADWSDILTAIRPILNKNGLAFSQPLRVIHGGLRVTSLLLHESGERLESDGIALAEKDHFNPQEFGSFLTYWKRYDGSSLLGIQPDVDDDGRVAAKAKAVTGRDDLDEKIEGQARIAEPMVRAFESACKQGGKTEADVKQYLMEANNYSQPKEIQKRHFNDAIKWALNTPKEQTVVTGKVQSKCFTHGMYDGEGDCPKCI